MPHDHHDHPHSLLPSDPALRVKTLETLLVRKGLVDPAAIEAILETYEKKVGPHLGARVVARAWADAAFRARLLADANQAMAELEISGRQGEHVVVVENTAATHNMVVCTLCSRPPGINPTPIAPAPCANRARFWPISA
jgi:nitrile hydratase